MDNDDITIFGETNFRNQRVRFGIKKDDRRRHIYLVGKTGVGKTTLLETLAMADIQRGYGVGIVDPHGEFAEKMLDFVPKERINDVIYFNPSDQEWPMAFNAIEHVNPEFRHLVASGLMGVFKKIWPDVWSARMEYIMNNCILALLEYPDSTLLGINRMLADKDFRNMVVERITDPVVKAFWTTEFVRYHDRFQVEAVAPIQNKVGQFISNHLIRNIIGQPHSKLNIREIMDDGKIIIMNLAKGLIGEDNSALIGAMLITKIQLAAMSRVDVPETERRDFFLHVDEFQNFATGSFANILSEARKYHLSLTLAHQYIEQLSEETVRPAVFGNVGTIACFRVGAGDAEFLEKEFMPEFSETDLVNLPKYAYYLKLMIDGTASNAFPALTIPPSPKPEHSYREEIIARSRNMYSTPRDEVEREIREWSAKSFAATGEAEERGGVAPRFAGGEGRSPMAAVTRPMWEAKCSNCGNVARVPFQPDPKRPVYCDDCLKIKRSEASRTAYQQPTSSAEADFVGRRPSRPPSPWESGQASPHPGAGRPAVPEQELAPRVGGFRSQPAVRSGEARPMSLSELGGEERAGARQGVRITPPLRPGEKKEVDIAGLRQALEEALREKKE